MTKAYPLVFEVRQVVHFTDRVFGPCAASARLSDPKPEAELGATNVRHCFGVYQNELDGSQMHLEDFDTLAEAQASLLPSVREGGLTDEP